MSAESKLLIFYKRKDLQSKMFDCVHGRYHLSINSWLLYLYLAWNFKEVLDSIAFGILIYLLKFKIFRIYYCNIKILCSSVEYNKPAYNEIFKSTGFSWAFIVFPFTLLLCIIIVFADASVWNLTRTNHYYVTITICLKLDTAIQLLELLCIYSFVLYVSVGTIGTLLFSKDR